MLRIFFLFILLPFIGFTQVIPQGINYQAVARDTSGSLLASQSLTVKFSVISDLSSFSISWQEYHTITTNEFGLFTAIIGQGIPTSLGNLSSFDLINWSSSTHFLNVEIDGVQMGTIQLLSVPYSFHSKTAENINPTDELQLLHINGDTLFISNGNYIIIE